VENYISGDKNQVVRRQKMMDLLQDREEIRVLDMSNLFHVSPVTIRKDFEMLENWGMIKRSHGSAHKISATQQRLNSKDRRQYRSKEKAEVARIAAKLVGEGDSVLLNVGSTSAYLCDELKKKSNIIIITNAFHLFEDLVNCRNIVTFFLGGRVDLDMQITVGSDVIEQMAKYKVDKLFLGMDGVDVVAGATSYNHAEDEIMQQMITQAKQKYLIVDDYKIGRVAFAHIADLTAFDGIITNYVARLKPEYQAIRELGVEVIFERDDSKGEA
jgi:DeoR/GlpR family transcriptional regulator of sugar metabolism